MFSAFFTIWKTLYFPIYCLSSNADATPLDMNSGYVDLLINEFVQRRTSNARYSERAFAQSLGLSPGFLKLLFQGKKQLGLPRAKEIANRLNWTEPQKIRFLRSFADSSNHRVSSLKKKFLLSDKDFFEISDWFHFAIIEFIKVKKGSVEIDDICKGFSLSKTEVSFALKHLLRLGVVGEESKRYSVPDAYEVPSISSEGIKKFHKQILDRAARAVDEQAIESRELRGLTLAFDKTKIKEAKKEVQKFVSSFEKKFGKGNPDSVYQLSVALFQLDKGLT